MLRVALWLKANIKVLRFIFRRMKFQLVKSLPSCCEIPSLHGAAPEGGGGATSQGPSPRRSDCSCCRTVFSRCGAAGKGAVFHGWWLSGAEHLQGACYLFWERPRRLARRKTNQWCYKSFCLLVLKSQWFGLATSERRLSAGKARAEGDLCIHTSRFGLLKNGLKKRRNCEQTLPKHAAPQRNCGVFRSGSLNSGRHRPRSRPALRAARLRRGHGAAAGAAAGRQRWAGPGRAGGAQVPQPGPPSQEEAGGRAEPVRLVRSAAGELLAGGGEPGLPQGAALPHRADRPPGCPPGLQPGAGGEGAAGAGRGAGAALQVGVAAGLGWPGCPPQSVRDSQLPPLLDTGLKGLTSGGPGPCVLPLKREKRGMCAGGDSRQEERCGSTELSLKHDETTSSTSFSRYLLFQLFEDVTEDELMSFKLLLVNELPKSKLTRETVSISLMLFKNYYYNP